jgi:hypothetical protein
MGMIMGVMTSSQVQGHRLFFQGHWIPCTGTRYVNVLNRAMAPWGRGSNQPVDMCWDLGEHRPFLRGHLSISTWSQCYVAKNGLGAWRRGEGVVICLAGIPLLEESLGVVEHRDTCCFSRDTSDFPHGAKVTTPQTCGDTRNLQSTSPLSLGPHGGG